RIGDGGEPLRAETFFADLGLGRATEDGAATDIISAGGLGSPGGRRVVGRDADQEGWRCGSPGCVERDVVGTEVNTIGTNCQRDIESVIDEEQGLELVGEGP